jgi:copper chaperone
MTQFKVPDMTCSGCVGAVTQAVRGLDAKAEVRADLDTKLVRIDSVLTDAALAEAVRDAGFTVEAG